MGHCFWSLTLRLCYHYIFHFQRLVHIILSHFSSIEWKTKQFGVCFSASNRCIFLVHEANKIIGTRCNSMHSVSSDFHFLWLRCCFSRWLLNNVDEWYSRWAKYYQNLKYLRAFLSDSGIKLLFSVYLSPKVYKKKKKKKLAQLFNLVFFRIIYLISVSSSYYQCFVAILSAER